MKNSLCSLSRIVTTIALERVGGSFLVCNGEGLVLGASPSGRALLARMGVYVNSLPLPLPLPPELWNVIASQAEGEEAHWRPASDPQLMLSCTRHALGDDWLLSVNEVSERQSALAQRLHHQRLESLGRVLAAAVHDMRTPLSSIVFGIDVLAQRAGEISEERTRDIVSDLRTAAFSLRESIDCLLDFVRLGPPLPSAVSMQQVLSRVQSLLRPQLRSGKHALAVDIEQDVYVTGNLLTIEQIFVNLVLNSLEAGHGPTTVQISARVEGQTVRVLVEDDGPGIRADQRQLVFEPMFTTKEHGVGLGLTSARESARSAGGDLQLVRWSEGTAFAVTLPICAAPVHV